MEVTVKVSKETYELGDAVAALVRDVKAQLADGWQPIGDSLSISTAVLKDLVPGLAGVDKVKEEMADKEVFATTCAVVGAKVVAALLG